MSCKVSRPSLSNGVCTVLNSASTETDFKQMFQIKFWVKCDRNFGSFFEDTQHVL